jgi:uncharacterized integral membrane protein
MSTQQPAPRQEEPSQLDQAGGFIRRLGTKRIVLILLVAYAVLLALFNLDSVDVSFVFFSTEASLFVIIALAAAVGFLAGYLFDGLRARRREKPPA